VATAHVITSPQAGGKHEFPSDHYRLAPRRDPPLLANLFATRLPCLPPWYAARSRARKRCFWQAMAELRRPKLISAGRLPNLGNIHDRDCHIMRHVANFRQRMNSEPKQKRERFQQLTQNPKVKTGKAFAADLRKSKIHPTVKKLTAWRKLNRLSQRKAVAVLAQYYFHATFASLRSWEEGRRSPNPHTAGILETFLSDHPTVERPKK
jgi:DNA-binding transcriptional regulator YiaG